MKNKNSKRALDRIRFVGTDFLTPILKNSLDFWKLCYFIACACGISLNILTGLKFWRTSIKCRVHQASNFRNALQRLISLSRYIYKWILSFVSEYVFTDTYTLFIYCFETLTGRRRLWCKQKSTLKTVFVVLLRNIFGGCHCSTLYRQQTKNGLCTKRFAII